MDPVIVVSTGRCGSTLLSSMVRLHPDLLSLSEFFATMPRELLFFEEDRLSGPRLWKLLSEPPPRGVTEMIRLGIGTDELLYRPGPPARFTVETGIPPVLLITLPHLVDDPDALYDELAAWVPGLDPRPPAEQLRRLFGWLCQRLGRRVWVERSGSSMGYVGQLVARFPEARIVHLHRDGRDCAVSMSRHGLYKMQHVAQRFQETVGMRHPFAGGDVPADVPDELRRFLPGSFDAEAFRRLRAPVEEMGRRWSDMVVAGCRELARLPEERVLPIGYEALTARPADTLRRLARFIGVAEDERWLREAAALARPLPPRWTELADPERARLVEVCAPGMRLLYESP